MKCFVPNCENTVGVTFPKESELKKKWLENLNIKDVPNLSSFVCLDHFENNDIYKNPNTDTNTVRNGAIPRLLVGETTNDTKNVDGKQNDTEPNKYQKEVESSENSLERKGSENDSQKNELQINDLNKPSISLNANIDDNQTGAVESTKTHMAGPPEVLMFDLNTKTCRLCAKEEAVTKNIFVEKIENVPVSVAIMECIYPIEISKEDKLSKEICLTCLSSLKTYFKFRSICLENDKKQRDLHIDEQYYVNVDDSPNKQKRKNIESTFTSDNKKQRIQTYDTTDTEDDYDSDDFEPLNTFVIEKNSVVSTNRKPNKQVYSLQKLEKSKGNLMMDKKLVNVEEELRKVLKGQLTEEQAKAENIIIHVENDDEAQPEKVVLKNLNLPIVIKPIDKNKLMKPSTSAPVSQRAIITGDEVEFCTKTKNVNVKTTYASQTGIFEGIPIEYVFNTEFCRVDGYLYEYRLCKGNLRFLRCVLPACPALGIQQKAGASYSKKITVQNSHNHKAPDENGMKKQMFYYVMKRKMQSDKSLNFKSVYEEVCSHDPDIKELVPLRNVINEICRHQLIHKIPPINSFKQFYEHIETDAFQKLHFTHNGKQFYQEKFIADDDCDSRAIVFANMDIIEQVSHSTLMYVDASFKIDTNEEFNYQLVTVLVWVDESYYPMLFALINKKTLSIYKKIFEYLHDTLASKLQPVEIVTDYEANLYYALGETYLDSSIGGSVFYYTQNLYKKICSLNLSRELETNSYFRNIYHMLLMLPLLPVNTILDGLNNMEIQARDLGLSELTRAIFDHVRTEWILKVSPDLFCVHRLENRINENVIAPFKKLRDFIMLSKGKIQKQNITIVNVVEKLIELEHFLQITYSAPNKKSFARDLSSSQKKNVLKAWQYIESHPKININNFFSKVLGYIKCMENQLWIWGFYRHDGDVTEELINASNFSIISNGIEVIVQNDGEVTEETESIEEENPQQPNEQNEKGQIVMEAVIDENGSFVLQNTSNDELGTQLNSLLKYVYKG